MILGAVLFHTLVSFIVWLIFHLLVFGQPPVTTLLFPLVLLGRRPRYQPMAGPTGGVPALWLFSDTRGSRRAARGLPMCSDPVIKTQGLGKCYQIYGQPRDRLLQLPLHRGKPRYRELWALKEVSLEIRKGEALRLPVVSTDFGEMSVRRHTPGVFLSDTAADIPQVMRQALAFSEPLANTLQFGEANSWTKRFEVALADPINQPTSKPFPAPAAAHARCSSNGINIEA